MSCLQILHRKKTSIAGEKWTNSNKPKRSERRERGGERRRKEEDEEDEEDTRKSPEAHVVFFIPINRFGNRLGKRKRGDN
jgi:hypothetical protein